MKQSGYIIENLLDKAKYFTSTSSYDRPTWVRKESASVYETADSAERAMKKLIKYGVNSIRMVNLAELAMPVSRIEDRIEPANDVDLSDDQDAENPDEMVAAHHEEVCPECGHEPCTCGHEEYQQGDEIDVDATVPPEENEEITNRATGIQRGHTVSYKGQEFVVTGDVGNSIMQIAQADNPKNVMRVHTAELLPVHESAQLHIQESTQPKQSNDVSDDASDKIAIPASVKSGLESVIKKFSAEADEYNGRDDARASFAMTIADAASEIKELLSKGTVASVKQAQTCLAALMNPITANFPADVLKFINSGGKKSSLKDLFDDKRQVK